MYTIAIVQVRIASHRLPGKALYPLDGVSMLKRQIRRAKRTSGINSVVVATTDQRRDDVIARCARETAAEVFRGAADDVLQRVARTAKSHDADQVVRLSGDNPLVCPRLIEELLSALSNDHVEYATNKFNRTFPWGIAADAMTTETLTRADEHATGDDYREHIGRYFASVSEKIERQNVTADQVLDPSVLDTFEDLTEFRLTVDYPEDYDLLSRAYSQITFNRILPIEDVITFVHDHELSGLNEGVDQLGR